MRLGLTKTVGIFSLLAMLILPGTSQGAFLAFSDTYAMARTNWNGLLSFSKFDPSLGTLNAIHFYLEGRILGDVRFESLDAGPATVNTYLQAMLTLSRPDMSTIVLTTPVADHSDNVTAFDGVIDFGGTSGRSYLGIQTSDNESVTSPPPASDLALFTGLGSIDLPISAQGMSYASGAGNLLTMFNTQAEAYCRVTYEYDPVTPPVPEPSSMALLALGSGLAGVGGYLRRKRGNR